MPAASSSKTPPPNNYSRPSASSPPAAPGITRRLISEFAGRASTAPQPTRALEDLTPRETEVLKLVAQGLSNAEIADRLVVTEETVKTHVSRILNKLGLRDRTQAVVVAYETRLVTPASRPPGATT